MTQKVYPRLLLELRHQLALHLVEITPDQLVQWAARHTVALNQFEAKIKSSLVHTPRTVVEDACLMTGPFRVCLDRIRKGAA